MTQCRIYVLGSLHNPLVPRVGRILRDEGHLVFDEWYSAGPDADKHWRDYEQARGHSLGEGLFSREAGNTYRFDKDFLDWATIGVLVLPAGKSGHLELGYLIGRRIKTYVLLDKEPETWDLMYRLTSGGVFYSIEDLCEQLKD